MITKQTKAVTPTGNSTSSPPIAEAMSLMLIAMLVVPGMDVIAKLLANDHAVGPVTIVFVRFLGQAILVAFPILWMFGLSGMLGTALKVNLLRGAVVGASVSFFFVSIKYLPLADAIAIFFVEPFILMLLSVVFLGEKIGWHRTCAASLGFAGALLIVQPSYEVFGLKALLPLATAFLFACYLLLSKKIGSNDHPLIMQFWSGIGAMAITAVFMALAAPLGIGDAVWQLPLSTTIIIMLVLLVVIATVSHLLIIMAFARAPASILAPFQYLEIITMTIAGYLVFGYWPSALKWLGILIIIGSGLYIFMRERQLEKRQNTPLVQ